MQAEEPPAQRPPALGLSVRVKAAERTSGPRLPSGATPLTLTGSQSAKEQPSPGALTSSQKSSSRVLR